MPSNFILPLIFFQPFKSVKFALSWLALQKSDGRQTWPRAIGQAWWSDLLLLLSPRIKGWRIGERIQEIYETKLHRLLIWTQIYASCLVQEVTNIYFKTEFIKHLKKQWVLKGSFEWKALLPGPWGRNIKKKNTKHQTLLWVIGEK